VRLPRHEDGTPAKPSCGRRAFEGAMRTAYRILVVVFAVLAIVLGAIALSIVTRFDTIAIGR